MIQAWRDLARALTDVAGAYCDDCSNKRQHRCLRNEVKAALTAFRARVPAQQDDPLVHEVAETVLRELLTWAQLNGPLHSMRDNPRPVWLTLRQHVGQKAVAAFERTVFG